MSKFLLLAIVFAAVWWLAKGFRRKGAAGEPTAAAPERMVNCEHCGVYLPQSEAVRDGERFFCNDEHRRLAG
ncbi:MAG: hypothetical protein IH604_13350 [Burkholderiales bacterium]|nr:hypothetical protein [Burkholderiales bacterium]